MALEININADIKKLTKTLTAIQKKQIPFATSVALNKTAEFTATNLNNDTRKYFDRPTPFTQKSFIYKRSNKRRLTAVVLAKRIQDEYLEYQIFGGTATPQGRAFVLPTKDIKRNQYGNIPRGRVKRLLSNPNVFSGVVFGIPGIWQRGFSKRGGASIRLLFAYEPRTRYSKLFPYQRLVFGYVNRAINPFFETALRGALRTAR